MIHDYNCVLFKQLHAICRIILLCFLVFLDTGFKIQDTCFKTDWSRVLQYLQFLSALGAIGFISVETFKSG